MPFLESLRKDFVVFPRAASVAPWTIPSHATMLTGLYPWEHGTHAKQSLKLRADVPTLAELLHPYGYYSFCLSSNFLLAPPTGLSKGFDRVAWGNAFDLFLRLEYGAYPPNEYPSQDGRSAGLRAVRSSLLSRLPYDQLNLRALLERNVFVPTIANRIVQGVRYPARKDDFSVARWIEPTLDRELERIESERPFLGLINLCDAHEPYFADRSAIREIGGWWNYIRLRQDRPDWLAQTGDLRRWNLNWIHELYRRSIRTIDGRIRKIVESLKVHDRWDNTLLVITSDHGQAMGEHGALFHRFRVDESLIRIPLWARFPHGRNGGATAKAWASLIDILPTFIAEAGIPQETPAPGYHLDQLIDRRRVDPVFAISDGILGENWIPDDRREDLDRIRVAAYQDDLKLSLETSPEAFCVTNLADGGTDTKSFEASAAGVPSNLLAQTREIARRVTERPATPMSSEVEDRLRSWGYI
jgi:arylsulfatase A-like enzyme